jgi:hypothetical protein
MNFKKTLYFTYSTDKHTCTCITDAYLLIINIHTIIFHNIYVYDNTTFNF